MLLRTQPCCPKLDSFTSNFKKQVNIESPLSFEGAQPRRRLKVSEAIR
jgi:hypothetical protein